MNENVSQSDKTSALVRMNLSVELLHPNPDNPNEMSDQQFNMLYDNIERVGLTDPILVRPHPEIDGAYRIIGGHHRFEVAKVMGYTEVPVTVIEDPAFGEDEEKFQMVRHNVIKGKMSPSKFIKLYESLSQKYADEILADSFGFVAGEEFSRLIQQTKKSLPKEIQAQFAEAAKEVKTIDDLSKVLNTLFATYGDTLPFNYMILDYGGKESVWLRMYGKDLDILKKMGVVCMSNSKTLDGVMNSMIKTLMSENNQLLFQAILDESPEAKVSSVTNDLPTLDFLKD